MGKLIKWGILGVHAEHLYKLWTNVDEKIEYTKEINDLINYMKETLQQKFNADVTDMLILLNEFTLCELICSWSDKAEYVDVIFIVGHSYFFDRYDNNADVTKIIERITTKHISKKYADVRNVIARLQSKITYRMRNKTFIINLFDVKDSVKCFDTIVTEVEPKLKLTLEKHKVSYYIKLCQKKLAQASTSSSSHDTDEIDENKMKSRECLLRLDKEKGTDIKKERRRFSLFSSHKSLKNEDDDSATKCSEEFNCGYYFDKKPDDGQMSKYVTDLIPNIMDPSIEKLDVASGVTIGTEFSSSETIDTQITLQSSVSNQGVSDRKVFSPKTDEEWESITYEQYPLITVENALLKIEEIVNYGAQQRTYDFIKINDAYGRILAEDVISFYDVPAFRVSAKHGYAVLTSDGIGKRIVLSKATSDPVSLTPGTCMYVKTGERIPEEATAVVGIKDVKRIRNDPYKKSLILITVYPHVGQNIKPIGSDISKGKEIISPFTRIGPVELELLVTAGHKKILVFAPISIGILSIGNLLEEPGHTLRRGYVYDSNRISLIALLKDNGLNSIIDFGIVAENSVSITKKIRDALKHVDILVTIGCTSDSDLLKPILKNDFNATIHFGNVFLKPGKSTTFATCELQNKLKYFVCVSRNPMSVLVSAHLFLLPILNGLHHMFEKPCKIPAHIHEPFVLHPRPRAVMATLRWDEKIIFARAISKENLTRDRLSNCQSANAILLLSQQTMCHKKSYPSFIPAYPI